MGGELPFSASANFSKRFCESGRQSSLLQTNCFLGREVEVLAALLIILRSNPLGVQTLTAYASSEIAGSGIQIREVFSDETYSAQEKVLFSLRSLALSFCQQGPGNCDEVLQEDIIPDVSDPADHRNL